MPKAKEQRTQTQQTDPNRECLAATITPASLDAERRSVDIVFFTGIDVPRYDWMKGEPFIMRFDLAGADLSLLNNGAPVFDNHDTWDGAQSQKGVVEKAWQDKNNFMATLRFSKRQEVEGLWQDIADKIVQKFSMGVNLLAKKELPQEKGQLRVVVITKWQPYEISTAPLPADNDTRTLSADTQTNSSSAVAVSVTTVVERATSPQEQPMADALNNAGAEARQETAATAAVTAPPVNATDEQMNSARQLGVTKEQGRITAILKTAEVCGCSLEFAKKHIADNTSIENFRQIAIDDQAQRLARGPDIRTAHADIIRDESDTRRTSMTGALLERHAPGMWTFEDRDKSYRFHKEGNQRLHDGARGYAACTLLDIAKECLAAQGINWRTKSRNEIATLAFQSTSDFPFILADVANKTLRAGYDLVPAQWRSIAARRTAADFKTVKEMTLDSSSRLELVRESGEFKRGALVEGKESWGLSTYGKVISITRQAIINDDLGAFTRVPQLLGQEVATLEGDIVFGIITTNGNLRDGNALFSTAHSNLVESGATISVGELGDTRTLLMLQTSTGGKAMNIVPRYLLVPAALGQLAEQYTSANFVANTSADINPMAGKLIPIIEARLDASDNKVWYMFGDPNSPNATVLIYAYLEGQEGPYTETRNGFDVDGVEIKIRHDFASAAVDFRGAVRNDGQ